MNVTVLQENLKRALALVGQTVVAKPVLPVLANVLLRTEGNQLRLITTNLETAMQTVIGAKVEQEGAITVPAKLLADLVATLPNDAIRLTLDERTHTVTLACANSRTSIKGIEADEFPEVPLTDATDPIAFEAELLRTAIGQVAFAAATDTARPVLTGVYTVLRGNELRLVAGDGFQLARKIVELPEAVATAISAIIPARALLALRRVLADAEEPVMLSVSTTAGWAHLHCGAVDLHTRLLDGMYPDLHARLPTTYSTRAVLDRAALAKATKQADVFAVMATHNIKLTFAPATDGPGTLTIAANAVQVGDNTTTLDSTIHGEAATVALNAVFLASACAAIDTPQLAIETQPNPKHPVTLRPVGDESLCIVIAPMTAW